MEIAERPKFRKYFTSEDLLDLLLKIRSKADFFQVTSTLEIYGDPLDNFQVCLA